MPELERPLAAPDLRGGAWLQGGPVGLAQQLGSHELSLSTSGLGLAAYAFTFVSCVVPEEG